MKIASMMIVYGELYFKMAVISINSFLKHNKKYRLFVITDHENKNRISSMYSSDRIVILDLKEALDSVIDSIEFKKFEIIDLQDGDKHDRRFSALKPLIMDAAVRINEIDCEYILSLDADTIFTGNIIKIVEVYLDSYNDKYDLYLVDRKDERMQHSGKNKTPGSGFTLWKKDGRFIEFFRSKIDQQCTFAKKGGSQRIIWEVARLDRISFMMLKDPFLHFVSPDLVIEDLTDEDIAKFKPAYIHLHGYNSYKRLLNFERIFCGL